MSVIDDAENTAVGAIVAEARNALSEFAATIEAQIRSESQADLDAALATATNLQNLLDQCTAKQEGLTAALAASQSEVADLTAQAAQDEATINAQAQEIAAQAQEIADLTAALDALTPKVSVGARNHDLTFPQANAQIGPLRATRVFWQDFPASWSPIVDQAAVAGTQPYPPEVELWISFKQAGPNLEPWCRSVPADRTVVLIPNHEPENGDFPSGAAFVTWFTAARDRIKAANPRIRVCHAAAGSTYASGKAGYDGSYIIPAAKVDVCTIDIYRPSQNLMKPLAQEPRFQRWLSFVKDRPAIGITEWAIGLPATDPTLTPLRPPLIEQDHTYLSSLPNLVTVQYWYTNGQDGKNYRPVDAASIAALKSMAVDGL